MPDCQLRLSSPLSRSCGAVPTGVATDTGGGAGADVGLELEPKLAFPPPRFFLLLPLLPPPPLRFAPMAPPTPLLPPPSLLCSPLVILSILERMCLP